MAYTKNATWVDNEAGGTPITAAKLNNIENGIEATAVVADAAVPVATGVLVVDAGSNLSTARPTGAACVIWQFDNGTATGDAGENIVNGADGDLFVVMPA